MNGVTSPFYKHMSVLDEHPETTKTCLSLQIPTVVLGEHQGLDLALEGAKHFLLGTGLPRLQHHFYSMRIRLPYICLESCLKVKQG